MIDYRAAEEAARASASWGLAERSVPVPASYEELRPPLAASRAEVAEELARYDEPERFEGLNGMIWATSVCGEITGLGGREGAFDGMRRPAAEAALEDLLARATNQFL